MSYKTTATIATENEVRGEILLMANADLSRVEAGGVPLFADHQNSARAIVGSVDAVRVEDGRLVADLTVTDPQLAASAERGAAINTSIGYEVSESGKRMQGAVAPDSWTLMEVSLVGMPADPATGLGRANGDDEMKTRVHSDENGVDKAEKPDTRSVDLGDVKERKRIQGIMDLGKDFSMPADEVRGAIDAGHSVEDFGNAIRKRSLQAPATRKAPAVVKQVGDPFGGFSLRALYMQMLEGSNGPEMERTGQPLTQGGQGQPKARHVGADCLREAYGNAMRTRTLQAGTAGAASELVGTDHLAGQFVDALRPSGFLRAAGVRVVDGLMGDVEIPRQSGVATASWLADETGALAETNLSTDNISMTPHESGVHSKYSRKLLVQADPSVEMLIVQDQRRTLELAAEAAVLVGSNAAGQPKGILSYTEAEGLAQHTRETNGTDITFANLVGMKFAPYHDNADGGGTFVTSSRMAEFLATKVISDDFTVPNYLYDDGMIIKVPTMVTNLIPAQLTRGSASSNTTHIIFGDFSEAILARWSGLDVVVDPYSAADTREVRVLTYQDVDVALRHPEAFAVIQNAKHA